MLLCWYNFKYRCFWSHLLNRCMNIWSICTNIRPMSPKLTDDLHWGDWWLYVWLMHDCTACIFCVSQRNVRIFWTLNLVKVMTCSFGTAGVRIIVIILCKALRCSFLMQNFAFSEFLIFFTCGCDWHFLHNTF